MSIIDNFDEIDCLDAITDDNLWNMLDGFVDKDENKSIENNNICKFCNCKNMVLDSNKSMYTCGDCGIESREVFDQRPEWTNFEDGHQENGRCGIATNPFLPKSSMGTVIGGSGYSRLRTIQSWDQMPYRERSLSEVLQHIDSKLKIYKITKAVIDNAKILYKNISEIKHADGLNKGKNIIIRGLNRRGLIAACAYYGAKLQGTPRSTKEIADIFGLKITQVTRGCRRFLELINYQSLAYNLHSSHAQDFIERFGYKLKLKKSHIDIAIKIAENINKLDIASDHQPTSVAAGSIMLMSHIYDLNIPKKSISDIFGISEVTITKTFKKIFPYKKILISDELTNILLKKINQKISNGIKKQTDDNNLDSSDIRENLSKIFIMPENYDSDSLLNGSVTLTSILNSDSKTESEEQVKSINFDTNFINIDINNLKITEEPAKRKRGRPKKVTTEYNNIKTI